MERFNINESKCQCHYHRIQEVLIRNKKHLHLGRVPKQFQALQRPAKVPIFCTCDKNKLELKNFKAP